MMIETKTPSRPTGFYSRYHVTMTSDAGFMLNGEWFAPGAHQFDVGPDGEFAGGNGKLFFERPKGRKAEALDSANKQ